MKYQLLCTSWYKWKRWLVWSHRAYRTFVAACAIGRCEQVKMHLRELARCSRRPSTSFISVIERSGSQVSRHKYSDVEQDHQQTPSLRFTTLLNDFDKWNASIWPIEWEQCTTNVAQLTQSIVVGQSKVKRCRTRKCGWSVENARELPTMAYAQRAWWYLNRNYNRVKTSLLFVKGENWEQ